MVPPERVTFQNLNISTVEFVAGALAEGFAARRTTERSRPNHYRAVSAVAFADLLGEVESKAETADVLIECGFCRKIRTSVSNNRRGSRS